VLRNCVKKRNRPFNDKDMLSAAGPSSAPVADANEDVLVMAASVHTVRKIRRGRKIWV